MADRAVARLDWDGGRRRALGVRQADEDVRGPGRKRGPQSQSAFWGPSFEFRVFGFHAHKNRMKDPENARYRVTENEKKFGPARPRQKGRKQRGL